MQLSLPFPYKPFMPETKHYPSEVTISIEIASGLQNHKYKTYFWISLQLIVKYPFPFFSAEVLLSLITALRQAMFFHHW